VAIANVTRPTEQGSARASWQAAAISRCIQADRDVHTSSSESVEHTDGEARIEADTNGLRLLEHESHAYSRASK
jgi:hypothetical protein